MSTTTEPLEAPGFREILTLAWPIALARAAQSVIGFCDALFVAPLGEDALAATTTGALNAINLFILPAGVAFIIQSFAAQLHGRGDRAGVGRQAYYGLAIAVLTEVGALASIPFIGRTLALFHYSPAVRELMTQYLALRLLSAGAVVGMDVIGNWYGAQGNNRYGMVANLTVMAVNVALLGALVPRMGVRGAALANVLATVAGLVVIGAVFARDTRFAGAAGLKLREFWRVLRFGLPNGLNWFLEFAAFTVFVNVMFASLGTTALAALMAVMQLNSVAFMPSFGVSTAGAILVGNAIGAGRKDVVPTVVRRTLVITCGWMFAVGLTYLAAPRALLSMFAKGPGASGFLTMATPMLMVSAAWQVFDASGMTLGEVLRAAGDTAWAMWARIVVGWVVFVPLSWWVVRVLHQGPVVTLLCLAAYLAILAVVFALRFRSGAWRSIALTEEPEGGVSL